MKKEYQKMIVITAPSGAGKTSITSHLFESISPAWRFQYQQLPGSREIDEKNGVDYYFISVEEFQQKILRNEFVEWEMVYEGKYYGTLKSELRTNLESLSKIPVMDIDVQGAIHVQKEYPVNSLFIFIKPPSVEELKKRLESRGSETTESLRPGVNKASYELIICKTIQQCYCKYTDFENACLKQKQIVNDFINK